MVGSVDVEMSVGVLHHYRYILVLRYYRQICDACCIDYSDSGFVCNVMRMCFKQG